MLVDAHVHLLGVGDAGSGCVVSPRMRDGLLFRFIRWRLGIRADAIDEGYVDLLVRTVRASRFGRVVLFAQDGCYDEEGRLDLGRTHLYIPNDYVLSTAARWPQHFWACASINPLRRDALEELDRVADGGAKMVKVHPPIQGVDPGLERFRPFYRRVAARGLVLVVHTGHEHSAPIYGQKLGDPARLATALEEGGTVVAAHAGTAHWWDAEDYSGGFRSMLERWPNLYGDTAILGNIFRLGALKRLAADPQVRSRLIHGSDFPLLPSNLVPRRPFLIWENNLLERDARIKEAYGIFEESARRAGAMLERRPLPAAASGS